jgi:hypothetical protein
MDVSAFMPIRKLLAATSVAMSNPDCRSKDGTGTSKIQPNHRISSRSSFSRDLCAVAQRGPTHPQFSCPTSSPDFHPLPLARHPTPRDCLSGQPPKMVSIDPDRHARAPDMQEKAENVISFPCNVTHHPINSPNPRNAGPVPVVRARRTRS